MSRGLHIRESEIQEDFASFWNSLLYQLKNIKDGERVKAIKHVKKPCLWRITMIMDLP